jgi:hypothetical protein
MQKLEFWAGQVKALHEYYAAGGLDEHIEFADAAGVRLSLDILFCREPSALSACGASTRGKTITAQSRQARPTAPAGW